MNTLHIQFILILSSLLLLTVLSGGLYAVANAKTTVSYLMEPGIYMEINHDGNISKVETGNRDAVIVLGDLHLLNMSIENAIALTNQHIQELGYKYSV